MDKDNIFAGLIENIESGFNKHNKHEYFKLEISLENEKSYETFYVHDDKLVLEIKTKMQECKIKKNMWIIFVKKLSTSSTESQFNHIIALNNLFNNQIEYLQHKISELEKEKTYWKANLHDETNLIWLDIYR